MNKILLEVIGLSYLRHKNDAFALVLGDKNSDTKLPIVIGSVEAQSIVLELEKYKAPRPLTHDLFKNFADIYKISVKEVMIDGFRDGVFTSHLVCEKDGETQNLDARASDCIALALRFGCPIYTNQEVMDEAGVTINESEDEDEDKHEDIEDWLDTRSIKELEEMMERAVEDEDYELASKLRDEINFKKIQ